MKSTEKLAIKAIFFDLGNVLVNYDAQKAAKKFSKCCKVPLLKVWFHFFTSSVEKAYTKGKISSYDFFKHSKRALKLPVTYKNFQKFWNDIFWINPGMEELLIALKRHYPLYLISNTNELHFNHIKKHYKILRHFKKLFPSHEMGYRKPEVEIYKAALKRAGFKPQEAIFIDDVKDFIRGAERAGMRVVRFRHKQQLIRDLKKHSIKGL